MAQGRDGVRPTAAGLWGKFVHGSHRLHTVPNWELECYTHGRHSDAQCLDWSWHSGA